MRQPHSDGLCNVSQLIRTAATTKRPLSMVYSQVDRHNSVIERTYELEKRAALVTEQIKVANHRIDDLEHISIEKEK